MVHDHRALVGGCTSEPGASIGFWITSDYDLITGDGNGPAGGALDPKPADFTDPAFWADRDDERIFIAIKDGAPAVGGSPLMVGWSASYNDDQIRALTEYVKTFAPQ